MKPIPKWFGIVSGGILNLLDRENFQKYLSNLSGEVEVIVRKKEKRRSLSQNSFYRVYLEIISDDTGEDVDVMHEVFKKEFLPARKVKVLGIESEIPPSTTELSTGEFNDYLKKIEALTGTPIPDSKKMYT